MSIFNRLFASLMIGGISRYISSNDRKPYNEKDRTTYKVQVQHKALVFMLIVRGNYNFNSLVPKLLYKHYIDAKYKEKHGEKLTPMEKTRLYGYLNPAYHAAYEPRKRR